MSKEVFPQLPPEASTRIESFPPELQASTEKHLLALSHAALHAEDDFGSQPIPRAELGEEHQASIDLVAQQMTRISELLSVSRQELVASGAEENGISFEVMADKAKRLAVEAAVEAKQAGDTEAAITSIESLLALEALSVEPGSRQLASEKSLVRDLVAKDLATELVEATHETFGLVAVQPYDIVPLSGVARGGSRLLRAASGLDFSDDFSEVAKAGTSHDLNGLDYGDVLALAKLAETHKFEAESSQELTRQALRGAKTEPLDPDSLVDLLVLASPLSVAKEIADLRGRRRAGDPTHRGNDMDTHHLDETIVKLVQKGELELAKSLVSSSPSEAQNLRRVVEYAATDEVEAQQLIAALEAMSAKKRAELTSHLQGVGVDQSDIDWILRTTEDPDSAGDIPVGFWKQLATDPTLKDLLTSSGVDLGRSAEALSAIDGQGLSAYRELLVRRALKFDDADRMATYLSSAKKVLDAVGQGADSEPTPKAKKALMDLASFEDPWAALEAAKTLFGPEDYLEDLHTLYGLVHPQYGGELAVIRPDVIAAFGALREYCIGAGITTDLISGMTSTILYDADPVGRAKDITEGLKAAGVSADTDTRLIYTIIREKDPASVGRAVAVIEQHLGEVSQATRNRILAHLVGSQDPEGVANAIVHTHETLQGHGLSIEEFGNDDILRAMHVVESGEENSIEKYCRDWKIQRECEQAYANYLEPVRQSGNRRAVTLEDRPKLADLLETKAQFERLGIPPDLAEAMLDSWLTFSALNRRMYAVSKQRTEVSSDDINMSLPEQGRMLVKQFEALASFVDEYGLEETVAIVTTFGIYNFMRYKPEQLHNQLISWQSGETATKNIVVSARSDWNGAVSDVGEIFGPLLGEDGLFCFEVNDATQLAKTAVAVGNRERRMGRNPEETDSVENFIIDGHANPTGILLGTQGQHLDAATYAEEPLNGRKANTYRRHLGSKFRVILKACSTAGEVAYGKNIARSISDHHDVRVEGSEVATEGAILIDPDGTVRFNSGNVPSTVYI